MAVIGVVYTWLLKNPQFLSLILRHKPNREASYDASSGGDSIVSDKPSESFGRRDTGT